MFRITVFPTSDDPFKTVVGEAVEVSSMSDLNEIVSKQCWSAGLFADNKRLNDTFIGCDIIGLDVDGGCTLVEAMEKFKGYQHAISTTRNHQKEKVVGKTTKPACDRFRVILLLDKPIVTEREYTLTWRSLQRAFPFIDKATPDAARFFFPSSFVSKVDTGQKVRAVSSLSFKTKRFLSEGARDGDWHASLYRAARDILEQEYTISQCESLCERITGHLDDHDYQTIKSAYSKPPRYPPRNPIEFQTDESGNLQIDLEAIANEFISPFFLQQVTLDSSLIYKIEEPMLREVALCRNEDVIIRHLTTLLKELPVEAREAVTPHKLLNFWKRACEAIEEPPPAIAWPDDDCWTIRRLTFRPTEGPHKAWDEFLNRITDAPAFMAFVWSCFEMRNRSRQAVWLYGAEGQDGKSTVLKVIGEVFGNAASALNNNQLASGSRFMLANFYNKRVVTYADVKNVRFPMTEIFRNLTSGDVVPIEFKGGDIINVQMYLKMFLAANELPSTTVGNADMSRLIVIKVDASEVTDDVDWEDRLREELPSFLFSCQAAYADLCPRHGQIRLSEVTKTLVRESAEDFQEEFEILMDKAFILEEDAEMKACDFFDAVKLHGDIRRFEDFKKYVEHRFKVKKVHARKGDDRIRVYRGLKLKGRQVKEPLQLRKIT